MPDIFSPVARVYSSLDSEESSFAGENLQRELDKRIEKLSLYIRTLYEAFNGSSLRAKMLKIVEDSRKVYYQETETTDFPWKNASNMISPLTTMGVDEVEPRLVSAVIGKEPYLKAKPIRGKSTKEEALIITKFDDFILKHKVNVAKIIPQFIHEQLLDGTIFIVLSWGSETKKVRRWTPDPLAPNGFSKQIQEIRVTGPQVELVPVEYVWLNDNVDDEDWEKEPVIRYVGNITVGELKQRALEEDGWLLPEDLTPYYASDLMKTTQQEIEGASTEYVSYADNQRPIEFLEAYIKFDFFGEDQVDENLIVLVEKNSFRPFRIREQIEVIDENTKPIRRIRFLKRRGVSWGFPLYTLIKGIQDGVDAMWNRCVNSADITMTPWGFIKKGLAGLRKSKIEVYPGNLVEIENPEAINFPNLSAFQPAQFVPLILQYVAFFERTLNVTDYMQGRESQTLGKKGSTATGTLAILQEGKIKFEYRGGITHVDYLELFKNIHDLCVSNMSIEEHISIVGQPVLKYSATDEYQFLLEGSDLISNRFVERQENEAFLNGIVPFMDLVNPITLLKDHLRSYEKEPIEEYINPELMQLIQQYLATKAIEKEMVARGLPPELAQQAAQQGFTADNVETFMKSLGSATGEVTFGGPEGTRPEGSS